MKDRMGAAENSGIDRRIYPVESSAQREKGEDQRCLGDLFRGLAHKKKVRHASPRVKQ